MKKFLFALCATAALPGIVKAEGFEFSQSGMAGEYYGIMETRDNHNVNNMPNRAVFRADGNAEAAYRFADTTRLGVHADYTLVYRQHDKDYSEGDWRLYPYLLAENDKYGRLTAGYTYNAAFLMHQGAQEISWLGIQDSNLPYYLSSANWVNGLKSVKFATPKSTNIMDDGRAFKLSYFTPEFGNTKFGFSYTPDNANRRGMVSRYTKYQKTEDGYTAAMQNKWQIQDTEIYTSFGYGIFNRTDKEASFGLTLIRGHWNMGMGYKKAYIDGNKNPITTVSDNPQTPAYFDNFRESRAWNFSIGCQYGAWKSNLAYLHTKADNTRNRDDLWVFSNLYALTEHFELYLVGSYLNAKGLSRAGNDNNRGYAVVTGVGFRF